MTQEQFSLENQLHFPSNLDSTMLSTFSSCPQSFFQEFILRQVPSGRSIHLHAGGAIASAMEDIRNYYYRDRLSLPECKLKAFKSFITNWGLFESPENSYKDFTNCWGVVEAYFNEYPPETDHFQPLMKADGAPATEFKFAIPMEVVHPITNEPILYSGRLDLLSEPQFEPGRVYGVDEKTTKALGPQWQYQWDMRGQFYGYTYAIREMGYQCAGVLVRGMAIQQTKFAFQEKPLFFSEYQLERWWREVNHKAKAAVQSYIFAEAARQQGDFDSMHAAWGRSYGDACSSYGGCQFKELCQAQWPWQLYQNWERRVWNPLAKDPTAESEDRMSQFQEQTLHDLMNGM